MKKTHYSSPRDIRKKKIQIIIDDDRGGFTYLGIGGNGMPPQRQMEDCFFGIFFAIFFGGFLLLMGIVFSTIGL